MASLRLFLLGSPQLERDGVPLALDTRKNTALIAYLAVTGEAHSREALATLLWPDSSPARARAILRRNLSVLNKTLAEGWLVADRQTIGLDPHAEAWLDVAEFRRLAQGWRDHGHGAHATCPRCLTELAAAAALYHDDFMAGFSLGDSAAFDDWQSYQTELLRQELGTVLAKLAQEHADRGDFATAIPYAQRWAVLEPLHESAQRLLIRLHAAAGNRSAALRQYERYSQMLKDEVGIQPDGDTAAMVDAIRSGMAPSSLPSFDPMQPAEPGIALPDRGVEALHQAAAHASTLQHERPLHNLPSPVTPFIGRERELAELGQIIQQQKARLVTIVGPAGMGKTRLAIEAAWQQVTRFRDGVWMVELAPLRTAEHIVPAIVDAMALRFHGSGDHSRWLFDHLRNRHMLLLLDNIEHLRGAGEVVVALLQAAPGLSILATSQRRLEVAGETACAIGGLPLETAELQRVAAEIFVQAARRVQVSFAPSAAEMKQVIRICQLVDGMPLGIILAASWIDTLSLDEIADEIAASVDFLSAELADMPRRQWSIRAVFDSMWQYLSAQERAVYRRTSVFRGGFTREAAQSVTGADLAVLKSLLSKSLITRDAQGRLNTHELLHHYAREQLEAAGDYATACQAHAETYLALAREAEPHLRGKDQGQWIKRLEVEGDNFRAALSWSLAGADVTLGAGLAAALGLFWRRRSRFQEAAAVAEEAIAQLGPESRRLAIPLQLLLGDVYEPLARYDLAAAHYEAGLRQAEELGDDLTQVLALTGLSRVAWRHGDYARAEAQAQLALQVAAAAENDFAIARALHCLGVVSSHQGRYVEAEELYLRSLAIHQASGNVNGAAHSLLELGWSASARGEHASARDYLARSLAALETTGSLAGMAAAQSTLGWIADSHGDAGQAQAYYRQALSLYDRVGHRSGQANTLVNLGFVLLHQQQTAEAGRSLRMALRLAYEMGDIPIALESLIGIAQCHRLAGELPESARLASLVGHHPALNTQVRQHRLEPLCASLRGALPPGQLDALMQQGTCVTVDDAIRGILGEN